MNLSKLFYNKELLVDINRVVTVRQLAPLIGVGFYVLLGGNRKMGSLKSRDIVFIGLMLFALFFGAGNLIFPPLLGQQAGENFWPAIMGFIVTGVGLPIVTVMAISLAKEGVQELANRIHPIFAIGFTVIVYLAIGPFFGIPRGANVAYEMGLKPFLSSTGSLSLFLYTFFFFLLVYWVSLNPSKLVDRIGSVLTPFLLGAIILLVGGSFFKLDAPLGGIEEKYVENPFITGFLEGYLTMDTIAALAFGIVVINAIQQKNVTDRKLIVRTTAKASVIAGLGLIFVYVTVGLLGAKMVSIGSYENGGEILTEAARYIFGPMGMVLLGLIVTLACFTTCVGLVAACSQYFSKLTPKLSYKRCVTLITLFSLMVANLGLSQIISISVPVLVVIYPLTIVLVFLAIFHRLFQGSRAVYGGSMLTTGLVSLYDGLKTLGFEVNVVSDLLQILPLYNDGLGWLLPAFIGGIGGFILEKLFQGKGSLAEERS